MASRIDPSRPGTIYALGWDVRQQLANAKADIEQMQGSGGPGPYLPIAGATIPVANPGDVGFRLEVVGGELDLIASGDENCSAWLYTNDNADGATGQVGIGSGNPTNANSGINWVYTGNVNGAGNSGDVEIGTGNTSGGDSGHIRLMTGAASGTRGSIILDASQITSPGLLYFSPAPGQDVGIETSDTRPLGTNSGGLWMGTSDAGAQAGDVSIYGGSSNGANLRGANVYIGSGNALTGNASGGDITIAVGSGIGTGRAGKIQLASPSLQGGDNLFITQMPAGDVWLTANARYDGANWQRIDVSAYAYAMVFSWKSTIPGEAVANSGIMLLRASPAANPINPTWWAVGGWENQCIFDQFRHLVVGGQGIEVDGAGVIPYGRFCHAGSPVRTGTLTNIFVDLSGVDDNASPSWFIGRKADGAAIERAPAGSTTLAPLWSVSNAGRVSELPATVSGAASPGTALTAAVNIVNNVASGTNVRLATAPGAGERQTIINATASTLTVNPPASGTVAGVATVTMAANTQRVFYSSSATAWW